ncbi:ead/Ea22-like family protein [Salmonella enterica]|nr:ead/Ea22-like family protein [Salmonella enterica]
MSNIDKQALREEFRYMRDHYNDPADRKKQEIYIAAEALLDELDKKQQYIKLRDQENEDIALTVGKLRVELEAAKKRIAELEKGHQEAAKQINSWRRLAKQNIAERGKDISELEAARQRIAELEAREVMLPADREAESEVSGYDGTEFYRAGWNARGKADREALTAAGIKVKG